MLRKFSLIMLFYVVIPVTICGAMMRFQPLGGVIGDETFPVILLAPYVLGILMHWSKKYSLDNLQLNFGQYLWHNFFGTLLSLMTGLSSVGLIWAGSGHGGLSPVIFPASYLTIFWIGVGADTINSGMTGNGHKPDPPAAAAAPPAP